MPNHDSLHLAKHVHRSLRRRIHAVLRMAHRCMGMRNKRLGVGSLTTGGSVPCGISVVAQASGGAVSGYYKFLLASTALAVLGVVGLSPDKAWAQLSCSTVNTAIGSIPAQNTMRCSPSTGQALQIISNQDGAQGATPEDLVLGGGGNTGTAGIAQFFRGGIDNSNNVFIQLGDPNRQATTFNVYANQMAIGMGANAVQNSFAIGVNSNASVASASAMGFGANASVANAIAIGTNSVANIANSVALGSGSTTAAVVNTTGATINGKAYSFAGTSPIGTVSVGATGKERTITNVAAGQISGTSTDAVNGSQLFATNQAVNAIGTSVTTIGSNVNNLGNSAASTIGGGTTFNTATGTLSGFSQNINPVSNTGAVGAAAAQTTVAGALNQLNTNTSNLANVAVKYDAPGGNKITLGATGGVGAPAGGVTITNLANGAVTAASTDGVNGSQLFAVQQTANKGWNANTGAVAGSTGTASGSALTNIVPGGTVTYQAGNNIAITQTGSTIAIATSMTPTFTSVTAGNSTLNTTGLTITGGPSVTTAGINAASKAITNVANGVAANDAVNVSQLQAVGNNANAGWNLSTNGATGAKSNVGPGGTVDFSNTDGNVVIAHTGPNATFNLASNLNIASSITVGNSKLDTTGLTITGGPSVTTAGINAASKAITNVAAGTNATDAVNLGQLNTVFTSVTNLGNNVNNLGNSTASTIGSGTKYDPATGTLSGFSQNITAVDNKGNAAAAPTATTTVGAALTQLDKNTSNLANAAVKYDDPLTKNSITLGNAGTPVTIGNVANGIAANDAVNVSQLTAVSTIANKGWNANTGTVAGSTGTASGSASTKIAPGDTVTYQAGNNIAITQTGNTIAIATSMTPTFTSVTAGGNKLDASGLTVGNTTVTTTGLTITGGPSVTTAGINAASKAITNVAAGTNATDAVNLSQLNTVSTSVTNLGNNVNNLGNSTASTIGGGTTFNTSTGTLSGFSQGIKAVDAKGNAAAAATNFTTVAGALTQLDANTTNLSNAAVKYDDPATKTKITLGNAGTPVTIGNVANGVAANDAVNVSQLQAVGNNANAGWNLSTNGATGAKSNVGPGGTVDLSNNDGNVVIAHSGPNATFNLASNLNIASSITVGNSKLDTTGLTITGGPSVTTAGINAASKAITNVAAGTNATDAVNLSQLNTVSTSVTNLGNNVNNLGNSTASNLGGGSTYNSTTGTVSAPSYNIGGTTYNNVGNAFNAVNTSVTALQTDALQWNKTLGAYDASHGSGSPQKITNVANGAVTSTSTDAVNGQQLFDVQQTANKGWNANTGAVAGSTGTASGSASTKIAPGDTVTYQAGNNIAITQTGNTIAIATSMTPTFTSVTAGGNKLDAGGLTVGNTTVTTTGLTITGGPSVTTAGINAASKAITNVAVGTNATDAVNLSQLNSVSTSVTNLGNNVNNLGNSTASTIGSGTKYDPATGTLSGFSQNITAVDNKGNAAAAPTATTTVGAALTQLDTNTTNLANAAVKYDDPATKSKITLGGAGGTTIGNLANGIAANDAVNVSQLQAVGNNANAGWNLSTNGATGAKSNVGPGGTVDFSNTDGNIVIAHNGPNATFDLASNLKIASSLSVGAVTINTSSVVVGASKLDAAGLSITGGPSVTTAGVDAGGKKVTNVANGDVTATSTDAINGSQLFGVVSNATANAVQYDDATKTKITLGGVGATQPTQITNLANGAVVAGSTDAVNGSQLYDVQQTANKGWNLTANGADSSNVAPGGTVDLNNTDGNLAITKTGNAVTFNLSKDVTVDTLTAGNSKLDTNGLTITGGPSVTSAGINAASKAITNVAAGTNATDAVNLGQLNTVSTSVTNLGNNVNNLGNSTASTLGGGTTYDPNTGTLTGFNQNITAVDGKGNAAGAPTKYTTVSNALTQLDTNTTNLANAAVKYDDPTSKTKITLGGIGAGDLTLITNLAKGNISATSTDAVNGSQLYGVSNSVANNFGGGSVVNPDGTVSAPSYNISGNTYNNVGNALSALDTTANKGWNANTGTVAGSTGTATGSGSTKIAPGDTVTYQAGNNIALTQTGNTIAIATSMTPTFDSVTAGGNKLDSSGLTVGNTTVTTNGLTIAGGPSVTTAGVDAGSKAITNVAAGTNATDAVNLGQLNTVSTSVTNLGNNVNNLGNSSASTIGSGTTYDPNTGTLSGFSQNVTAVDNKGDAAGAPTNYTTVGGALTQLDTNTTNLANAAVKYDDPAVKDRITLGNAGTPVTIGNVANGVAANDAVNVSQLQAVGNNANAGWNLSTGGDTAGKSNVGPGGTVDLSNTDGNIVIAHNGPNATFDLAKSITLDSVTAGGNTLDATGLTVGGTTVTTTGLTIAGGPSVTTAGINAASQKITNLADGSDPNDAVNFSQLNTVATSVTNLGNNVNNLGSTTVSTIGGGATYDPTTGKIANFSQNITAIDGKGNIGATTPQTTVAGALTQLDTNTTNLSNAAVKYDDPTKKDTITLGNAGTPVTIGNVANGVAANDAVNVSQLDAVNQTANKGWNLSTNNGTTTSNVAPGGTVDLNNTDKNIVITQAGSNATFNLASDVKIANSLSVGAVTIDTSSVGVGASRLDATGLTIAGGPSVTVNGVDAGNKAITNVAAGTNVTDAVNVGQLQTVSNAANNLGNSVASNLGGGSTYDPTTGTVSAPSYTIGGTDYNNVGNAFNAVNTSVTALQTDALQWNSALGAYDASHGSGSPQKISNVANGVAPNDVVNLSQLDAVNQTANKGWNLTANGANSSNVAPGDTVDLNNTDGNIAITKSGNAVTFNLASDVTIANSLTIGAAKIDTTGLVIDGGPSVTTSGIDAGGKKITNVAKGDVSTTSTDAVNGSQIFSLGNSVASGLGGGSSFDPGSGTVITSLNYGGSTFTSVQSVLDKIGGSINGGGIKYFHANSTGPDSVASGTDSVGIGPRSVASGDSSVAMGNGAQSSGKNAIATGTLASASADNAIATGNAAEASGASSVATGNGAKSSGESSIATGTGAEASGNNSMASGTGAKASADGAIASGNGAEAGGTDSIATGTGSKATQANSVAMGTGADTSGGQAGDVALGAGSKTSTVVQTKSGTVNGTTYDYAGGSPTSTVSVGSAGNERTVTNVAAGQVTATSTDAVNGSQLYATNQEIGKVGQQVANLAENAVQYDAGTDKGSITLGGKNGTTITNVANGAVNAGSSDAVNGSQLYDVQQTANKGWNLSTAGDTANASKVAPGATVDFSSDNNMVVTKTVTQTGDVNVQYALAKDIKVDSVTAGGNTLDKTGLTVGGTTVTSNGVSIANGPSMTVDGINAAGKKITNVAAGTAATDAVNFGQLTSSAQSVADALGGGSTVNPDGTVKLPNYTVGGNSYTNVGGAITALDKRIDSIGGNIANLQSQVSNNLKEARQGIASAMAASALRYDDRPGKVSVAGGMAVYHRQVGMAAGLGWTSEDAKWRANVAGTYSPGGRKPDFGVMGGLSYTFN
ncbi:beta strand repeat-containing protein [Labrys sp. KB_33_2]|uniref:beta strand repeat-containing protein n=1 Tax=Labrys sp. KB_33_2 TaxID=3237479 RepID=UPI003F92C853